MKMHGPKTKVNQITFYFVEEGPGRGSEDIEKQCDVICFDFFWFFYGRHGWKSYSKLKRTALK